ncbi:MBL fold metallo-hydrolase [Planctomyces sp. SH-PL62]|uniref:MBL fold metallo-hydrolase n=1 Tax=Planctomyces sp. SH-PL62 TaxID=1636152 RepID=UPI00078ECA28|nr:MBL fold metallo-hydrolase [Planctomyces sp. SH-PL62]AMV37451.1 putative metallo-hydrolase YflN [Planctomyces sp. SH-PL62]
MSVRQRDATDLKRAHFEPDAWPRPIAEDLAYLRTGIVNVFFAGEAGDRNWVLIDAGLAGWADSIADAAADRFGEGARPSAIILTHGHFDHVGALRTLAERWDAPVYAHPLELPYLTGRSSYPPPDPTVGGGAMATLSWLYPRGPIDLGGRVRPLPADGSVPGLPRWRWVHTPGHTPGHVSCFRDEDRTLVAGDAFVTTRQESALAVLTQRREIHGPPMYYTSDWAAARRSVKLLADLEPETAGTGHGEPLAGEPLRAGLRALDREFRRLAVPAHGRYVSSPAISDAHGVVDVPPDVPHPLLRAVVGFGVGLVAGAALHRLATRPRTHTGGPADPARGPKGRDRHA